MHMRIATAPRGLPQMAHNAEVVAAIKHVTDLMGEISAASNEQSQGVSQVGEAAVRMDQVTQQNAVLGEEMAAAASSLQSQAQDLVGTVAVFKLAHDHGSIVARSTAVPSHRPRAVAASASPRKLGGGAALPALAAMTGRALKSCIDGFVDAGSESMISQFGGKSKST